MISSRFRKCSEGFFSFSSLWLPRKVRYNYAQMSVYFWWSLIFHWPHILVSFGLLLTYDLKAYDPYIYPYSWACCCKQPVFIVEGKPSWVFFPGCTTISQQPHASVWVHFFVRYFIWLFPVWNHLDYMPESYEKEYYRVEQF